MSTDSPSPTCQRTRDAASDYLDGHISDTDRSSFEAHLDACADCEDFVQGFRMTVGLLGELRESEVASQQEANALWSYEEYYPEPKATGRVADWTPAKEAWGELMNLPDQERVRVIQCQEDFRSPLLCDWLMARAKQASAVSPERALPLARAAAEIAHRHESELGSSDRLTAALVVLAGCYSVLREFVCASRVLEELEGRCKAGDVKPDDKAGYYGVRGLYYSFTGQFDQSDACFERALQLRREFGSRETVLGELVNLAGNHLCAGRTESALELYFEAEQMLKPAEDPLRLQIGVFSSLVLALCQAGRPSEARQILPRVRELSLRLGGWYSEMYTKWLEGTLAFAEGRLAAAQEVFAAVRSDLRSRGHVVWYVEASLDLARVYIQREEIRELSDLASELEVVTAAMEADEGTKLAVRSFNRAVRERSLSDQVLRAITAALKSAGARRRH